MSPPSALAVVLVRTLELADSLCWRSLTTGEGIVFDRLAAAAAQLGEFGVCARLLDEDD
jgi:hypothetical protein